jgi:hypothetical protein
MTLRCSSSAATLRLRCIRLPFISTPLTLSYLLSCFHTHTHPSAPLYLLSVFYSPRAILLRTLLPSPSVLSRRSPRPSSRHIYVLSLLPLGSAHDRLPPSAQSHEYLARSRMCTTPSERTNARGDRSTDHKLVHTCSRPSTPRKRASRLYRRKKEYCERVVEIYHIMMDRIAHLFSPPSRLLQVAERAQTSAPRRPSRTHLCAFMLRA